MPHALTALLIFGMMLMGVVVGAVVLRAAGALFNLLAGSSAPLSPPSQMGRESETAIAAEPQPSSARSGGVPALSLGQAAGIIFVAAIVNALAGFLVNKLFGGGIVPGRGPRVSAPFVYLVTLPIRLLVIGVMLPTTFGKGVLVALIYELLCLLLAAIVFMIVLVLGGLANLSW